jgi:RNA polymerase sigma factor (sigma-70 family)
VPDPLARSLASLTRRLTVRHEADDALLGRYVSANDAAAFAELVRRHGPTVLGVCRRMLGHDADADDAFQAAFLVLARRARSVRKPAALSAWLYGTAVRVCRKALGKRGAPRPLPAGVAAGDDPFAAAAWREVRGLLDDEVGRLPEALRDPLLLCYFDGLSRDEAAEKLGCSRRTLMRRLGQARQRLRRRLQRRGVAALGLGAAVLSPEGLAAPVPDRLRTAAVGVGTGGPIPASVRALTCGTAGKLLSAAAGLLLLLAAGGLGVAAFGERPAASAPDDRTPQQEKAPPRDADGRPLPAGAAHRLGSRRFRIEGRSDFILPSPDGKYVLVQPQPSLSAYAAQGLMLLDADTGLRVRSFEDSRRVPKGLRDEAIRPAAFSPDGKKLYALGWHRSEEGGDRFYVWASFNNPCKRVVLVWDVATGKRTAEWDLPPALFGSSLLGLQASADGKRLYVYGAVRIAAIPGRTTRGVPGLHILDAATGKTLQTWDRAGQPVGVTPGGKEVIAFREGAAITAHDVETGKAVRTYPLAGFVSSAVLSPDGKTLAAVALAGHPDRATGCEVKLWEAATGREVRRLTADAAVLRNARARLTFAADGKTLYLGTGSGRILRWDLSDGRPLSDWPAHQGPVADLFLRPGKNELVSAGAWDGAVRRWDAVTGKSISAADAYVGGIAVARTADGKGVAIADVTGRLDVWDVAAGRILRTLHLPAGSRRRLLCNPDGRSLLDATGDGKITVRDADTGRAVREIAAAGRPQGSAGDWDTLTFSPDGRTLLAAQEGYGTRALSWPDGGAVRQWLESHIAAYSPDGRRMIAGNWNRKTLLFDPQSGAARAELPGESLTSAAFSHDGRRLATAHLYGVWRVRAGDGAVLKEFKGFQHVWCVAFSPSGWLLAVAGDNAVGVYDTASWQEVARFDGHDGTVRTVFFGPDDGTLISASAEDGTALVWSLKPPAGREPPDPDRLWADLTGDGPAVRRAVWAAARHPEASVPLFRRRWPIPEHLVDAVRIRKLIGRLDSETFAEREAAEAELVKLGPQTEAELRKALAESTSAEVKRRAKRVLDRWAPPATAENTAEEARELRAVWALELAGTAEAKELLEAWARAKVGARLCEEAAAALKRRWGGR